MGIVYCVGHFLRNIIGIALKVKILMTSCTIVTMSQALLHEVVLYIQTFLRQLHPTKYLLNQVK